MKVTADIHNEKIGGTGKIALWNDDRQKERGEGEKKPRQIIESS